MTGESIIDFNNTAVAFEAKDNRDLKRAKFLFGLLQNPVISRPGQALMKTSVQWGLPVKGIIKATLYKQFIGGENLKDCGQLAYKLNNFGVATILDYAMEGEDSEEAYQQILEEFKRNIDLASDMPNIPASVFKPSAIARNEDLHRLSHKNFNEWNEVDQNTFEQIKGRFETIFEHAYDKQVPVMVDAEESWIQAIIDYLVLQMMARYNQDRPIVVNTYQLYRKDRLSVLKSHFEKANQNGFYFGVKLVRGAYLEQERNRAAEKGYESPVHDQKADTDKDYDQAVSFCMDNIQQIFTVIASHNENSNQLGAKLCYQKGLDKHHPFLWFSQLYGMADHISFNLAEAGFNVAKYIPYGPVKAVVPYLLRRAEENSSVQGQVKREVEAINEELGRRKNGRTG